MTHEEKIQEASLHADVFMYACIALFFIILVTIPMLWHAFWFPRLTENDPGGHGWLVGVIILILEIHMLYLFAIESNKAHEKLRRLQHGDPE